MRKLFVLMLFLITFSTTMNAISYSTSFSLMDVTITHNEQNYDEIRMKDCAIVPIAGSPLLPTKSISLIIPNDKEVGSLDISVNPQEINGEYNIMPGQTRVLYHGYSDVFTEPDPLIYNADKLYPDINARIVSHGFLNGANHLVHILINPIQYNPVTKKLYLIGSINISLNLTTCNEQPIFPVARLSVDVPRDESMLYNSVDNPEDIPLYRYTPDEYVDPPVPGDNGDYNYVVICPSDVVNCFSEFKKWKEQKGNFVSIKTYSMISADYPQGDVISVPPIQDTAGSIRQFLSHQASEHCLKYALIVGDMNDPIRLASDLTNFDDPFYQVPCDLYFGDFQANWNSNNIVGHYGVYDASDGFEEDILDFDQEISVGRLIIPVPLNEQPPDGSPSREEAIANWIHKLITYEKNPGNGYDDYLQNAYVLSALGDTPIYNTLSNHGFITTYTEDSFSGIQLSPSGMSVIADINEVNPSIISLCGHGNKGRIGVAYEDVDNDPEITDMRQNLITSLDRYNVPSYCIDGNETGNGFDILNNIWDNYPILLASSCNTAQFDWNMPQLPGYPYDLESNIPSCAEAFTSWSSLFGGPLYVGNTREGYTMYQWDNNFMNNVFSSPNTNNPDPWCGGAAFNSTRSMLGGAAMGYSRIQAFSLNYFGDPEMDIWTASPGKLSILLNMSDMSVQIVDQTGIGVEGVTVVFQNASEKQIIFSDVNGYASSTIEYSFVTATKHNFIPDELEIVTGTKEISSIDNQPGYIEHNMYVSDGGTLTLNGDIHFRGRSSIDSDGLLIIFENSHITGLFHSENISGVLYKGNKITINGLFYAGDCIIFDTPSHKWDGIAINETNATFSHVTFSKTPISISNSNTTFSNCSLDYYDDEHINTNISIDNSEVELNTCDITNTDISSINSVLHVENDALNYSSLNCTDTIVEVLNGNFCNSPITVDYGFLTIDDVDFLSGPSNSVDYHTVVTANDCSAVIESSDFSSSRFLGACLGLVSCETKITINNCHFYNHSSGNVIHLINLPNYEITGDHIYDNNSGIKIDYSGQNGDNIITDNTIEGNASYGLTLYNSICSIVDNNVIQLNGTGLKAYYNSSWVLSGDPEGPVYQAVQYNDGIQIILDGSSSPEVIKYNFIVSSNNYDYMYITNPIAEVNVARNYWGDNNNFIPEEDLYPFHYFSYSDPWAPGDVYTMEEIGAAGLYRIAYNHELAEEYDEAIYDYKQIITNFPKTEYAVLAAKALLRIEDKKGSSKSASDYLNLRTYYLQEDSLHITTNLDFFANNLANLCNLRLNNYEDVINYYESIIVNSPTYEDSIFAAINLGYVYLLMENTKSGFVGKMLEYIPVDLDDWIVRKEILLDLITYNDVNDGQDVPLKVILRQNYPNPFNPSTTIRFGLMEDAKVKLLVYNVKGQLVKTLVNEEMSKGYHNVIWSGKDENSKAVASGLYYYVLINNNLKIAKKMMLLK